MKAMIVVPVLAFLLSSSAFGAAPGFYYNSLLVDSPVAGKVLFDAMKSANQTDEEIDVCYEGSFDEAIVATELKAAGTITLNLIDVYGESEFPALDLEVSNDKNESAYGIVHSCN